MLCVRLPGALAALLIAALALADAPAPVQYLNSGKVAPPGAPFSEAVRVGDVVYLSGMVGIVPGRMQLAPGGIKAETAQALENIRTVLAASGLGFDDLVKCTAMLADIGEWPAFNEVYRTYFSKHLPARSAFAASGLVLGARIELECTAHAPG